MIKRTAAIVLIMIANIMILAHAVIPHHHHNKQVCLINSHFTNESFTDEHGTDQDSHSHHRENNSDDCVLKLPLVIFSNQWKTDFKIKNIPDRSSLDDFHYNLLNNKTEFQIQVLSSFYYERITHSSYSSLVSASLGLRAPPVV